MISVSALKERIKRYFTQPPSLCSALSFSPLYLSGIHVSPREKRIKSSFLIPLEGRLIEPSFTKKNIKNPSLLTERLREGLEKLGLHDKKTACLIPELSLKAFVLSFDSLPSSQEEKEQLVRFRIKKQMGFFPEDGRLSFQRIGPNRSHMLLVSLARKMVIEEYEDLLGRLGLKVTSIGSPTFGLYNVLDRQREEDFLLINIERESLSLLAAIQSEITLYRQKPLELRRSAPSSERVENIVNEVENTVHFIEDRESKKIQSLYIRFGFGAAEGDVFSELEERLTLHLKRLSVSPMPKLGEEETEILSPLIGQIL